MTGVTSTIDPADRFDAWWLTPMADRERFPTDDAGAPVCECVHANDVIGPLLANLTETPSAFAVHGHPDTELIILLIGIGYGTDQHDEATMATSTSELIDRATETKSPAYFKVLDQVLSVSIFWPEGWHKDNDISRVVIS